MRTSLMFRSLLAAAATLLFYGCSSGNGAAPSLNPATGQHPANWQNIHYSAYLANPASCTPCHGSATDASAAGGTSGVSCFTCHPNGPNHPSGWSAFMQHGRNGAQLATNSSLQNMAGFATCKVCHGSDYNTGISGVGPTASCYACHTKAPHPDAPWGATNPPANPAIAVSHDQTDASNAPECYTCHYAGSAINQNLGITTLTPAAGAQPGCFNSTMCHGASGI